MIAYITINDETNLGNRLQSYATYVLLSKYDKTHCLIRNYNCDGRKRRIPWSLIRIASKSKNMFLSKISSNTNKSVHSFFEEKRKENFKAFSCLIENGEILSINTNYSMLEERYDCFVAGSDQLWNPSLFPDMYLNMLGFVKTKRKFSFASSISRDKLFLEEKYEFKKYLKSFYKLSCREESGSRIIYDITHKKCETLIDPTLMLEKEDWISVMNKPEFHTKTDSYILLYFLGGKSKELERIILKLRDEFNMKTIDIYDKDSVYYSCGPKEFIYLINNAALILTDSFHGSVFSYIFDKPFRTFIRNDNATMNSRLVTFKNKLKLDDDIFVSDIKKANIDIRNVTYKKEYLRHEQEKVYKYLDESLF